MPYMDVLKIDVTILAGGWISKNLKHVRHPLISEYGHVTPSDWAALTGVSSSPGDRVWWLRERLYAMVGLGACVYVCSAC